MTGDRAHARRVVVVGGGVFGVASSLALRRRGDDVALVDAGRPPRPEAASTDISKIVRMDYGADALYTELMERALPVWRAWNEEDAGPLYHGDGFLLLSRSALGPGTFEGDSFDTLQARGHTPVRVREPLLRERWPAWNATLYPDGYFNPDAGWAESGRVVERLVARARAAGIRVREGDPVSRLIEAGGRIAGVATASGARLDADVVLVAAGAWTPTLLPHLSAVMWPVAQPVFHLKPGDAERWRPPAFPVWAADISRTGWYGFPANKDGIVKIAHHGPGRRVDPDAPRTTRPEDEAALRAFLRESLPGLADAPLHASKTCLYGDSFDGDFFIGLDPDRPGLAVVAGDSGHGFKFAPVIGEIVADAIDGKETAATRRFEWRTPRGRRTEGARFGMS